MKWVGVCDAPAGGCGFGKRKARVFESERAPAHGGIADERGVHCHCGSQIRRVSARTEARVLKEGK